MPPAGECTQSTITLLAAPGTTAVNQAPLPRHVHVNSNVVRGFANDEGIERYIRGLSEGRKGTGSGEGVVKSLSRSRRGMSAEILSTPSSTSSGFGAWLSDLEGRLRYQPWWIYITTLDRR